MASSPPDESGVARRARWFFDWAERGIYSLIAFVLLVTGLGTCGYAISSAVTLLQQGQGTLSIIFTVLNDLLLVLIILEVLRTVVRFIGTTGTEVGIDDLTPFLVIGAISAVRRILAIGANLSVRETGDLVSRAGAPAGGSLAEHPATSALATAAAAVAPAEAGHFERAMIELGVNGILIIVLTFSLWLLGSRARTGRRQGQTPEGERG